MIERMKEFDCIIKICGKRYCNPKTCKEYMRREMSEEIEKHKKYRRKIDEYYQDALKRINELEQQKAELIQLLKEIDDNVLIEWPYEYLYYRNRVAEIINK